MSAHQSPEPSGEFAGRRGPIEEAEMSERLRESLSALMDDEADDLELARVLRAMEEDGEVRATWARYQLVSTVLREHAARPGADLLAPALAVAEDEVAAGRALEGVRAPRRGAWMISFATAASVTLAVVLGIQWQGGADDRAAPSLAGTSTGASLEPAFAAAPLRVESAVLRPASDRVMLPLRSMEAAAPRAAVQNAALTPQRHLQTYMLHHAEVNALNSRAGMMPFARVAAFEGAP
ncbi:MAG: sigma-E factor negative regulatory protein [Pseudomonadales bacterium]|jgi:sigma-E factor negative regulatory protein RseA|nr:sigma-E factor negative regulatory protein [Pseudomonadales bacterium]